MLTGTSYKLEESVIPHGVPCCEADFTSEESGP